MRIVLRAMLGIATLFAAPMTASAQVGVEHFRAWDRYERASTQRAPRKSIRATKRKARKSVVARLSPPIARNPIVRTADAVAEVVTGAVGIVANPPCPAWVIRRRVFCGCGVSIRVFGTANPRLFTARAWLRFPPAAPAPGMIAANHRHVFYIERVLGNGRVLAYDPNSGGGKTRIHVRSLRGFSVRNPRA